MKNLLKVKFPAPVSIGNTLRGETEIINKRESKSNPNRGNVMFRGYNQKGELVVTAKRAALMVKS